MVYPALFLILGEGIFLRNFVGLFTAFISGFRTLVEGALGSLALLLRQSCNSARTRITVRFSIGGRDLVQVYGGDGLRHRHLSCQYLLLEHHLDIVFESLEGDEDHRDVVE